MDRFKNNRLIIVPEGPVAFDGLHYRYSKGERRYLDALAEYFDEVILYAFVQRPGEPHYEMSAHSRFSAPNLRVLELTRQQCENPSVFQKAIQFFRVFLILWRGVATTDYVYLFLPAYPSAMAWIAARLRKKTYFVYAADDWEQATPGMFKWDHLRGGLFYRAYARLNTLFERNIAKHALFSVTAGQSLLEKYQRFGRPVVETTPRMTLSPEDVYHRKDTCLSKTVRILHVGSLIFDKAQHCLLEAFATASKTSDRPMMLDIIGTGPRREELQTLAESLGISNKVIFHGHIQDESDLYTIFQATDIFVLTSVSEGFPRVLYEAMAQHLPIITTDCGGIAKLMHNGKNAIVCPVNDVNSIANAIIEIMNNPALRQQCIREASKTIRSVFQRFNPAQIPQLLAKNEL